MSEIHSVKFPGSVLEIDCAGLQCWDVESSLLEIVQTGQHVTIGQSRPSMWSVCPAAAQVPESHDATGLKGQSTDSNTKEDAPQKPENRFGTVTLTVCFLYDLKTR